MQYTYIYFFATFRICRVIWDVTAFLFCNFSQCNISYHTANTTDWLTYLLTGWLTDWMTDWLTDQLADLLINWLTDQLADLLINWLTDQLADLLNDWLTDWLSDWLTVWLKDWLTNWPTDWLTYWLTDCTNMQAKQSTGQLEVRLSNRSSLSLQDYLTLSPSKSYFDNCLYCLL